MKKIDVSILGLFSVVLLLFCNMCSPIYPTNWWCDANIFQVMGNEIWNGKVLYRDIYDQKGPVIFLIHALGRVAGAKTFLGTWLLLICACWGTLAGLMKTMMLWVKREVALPLTLLVGAVAYCSINYGYGDTSEEWSLPVLAWVWYLFLRYAKKNELPNVWESILMGIGMALVFWNKYTIVLMFGGELLGALIIAVLRHEFPRLIKPVLYTLLGFVGVSAAIMIAWACMGALGDLIDGYFLFNLQHYTTTDEGRAYTELPKWILLIWALTSGLFWLLHDKRDVKIMTITTFAASTVLFYVVFCFFYYYLIIYIFMALIAISFERFDWVGGKLKGLWAVCLLLVVIRVATCYNVTELWTQKDGNWAAPMAERILQDDAVEGQGELMLYDHQNPAVFLQTNYPTKLRYFFRPNSTYPAIMEEQNANLEARAPKWVVTGTRLSDELEYELVAEGIDYNRGGIKDMILHAEWTEPMYLYKRK